MDNDYKTIYKTIKTGYYSSRVYQDGEMVES